MQTLSTSTSSGLHPVNQNLHPATNAFKTVRDAGKVVWVNIRQKISFSSYKIKELNVENISDAMQQKLKNFEQAFDYPLGDGNRFRIVHGAGDGDYFAFAKSLGEPKFYVAINKRDRRVSRHVTVDGQKSKIEVVLKKGDIAGVCCKVLRNMDPAAVPPQKAWYLCDLKVKEEYRGEHIPLLLLKKNFWRYFQSPRGYAICMNPGDGSVPKAAQVWQRHGPFSAQSLQLNLYTIRAEQFSTVRQQIERACHSPITFKSMAGIKDFEIFKEADPAQKKMWQLLHIQHGPKGEQETSTTNFTDPQPEYDHLIAAVGDSSFDQALAAANIQKFSAATLLYYGLDHAVFENSILTNEI